MDSDYSDDSDSDFVPEIYDTLTVGNFRYSTDPHLNIITAPTRAQINLVKSKTARYYDHAKIKVELCKPVSGYFSKKPWFECYKDQKLVKGALLTLVNNHACVYDFIFKYVTARCVESEKMMEMEIGRKPQVISTNVLATEPFPVETLWVYVHIPESIRNKLNSWVNSSFQIGLLSSEMEIHSEEGTNKTFCWVNKPCGNEATRFDYDSRWIVEKAFSNAPDVTDTHFTVDLRVDLIATTFHHDFFMPDYFTSVYPRPWTGELIQVQSSGGDSRCCFLAAVKSSSKMLEAQLRWNEHIPLTLEVSSEVFDSLIEFINDSNFPAATKSFTLAVDVLFAANKYDIHELQDKLLDWFYVLPVSEFDDAQALIELYLLLDFTRVSECVFKRIEGIVNLKASLILPSQAYKDLDHIHKSIITSLISNYDVVLDMFSLWTDNRPVTKYAKIHADYQNKREENDRIQLIHKRKPWQLCCDYLNYCNYKVKEPPPTGLPYQLIKIKKEYFPVYPPNPFLYDTRLVFQRS